MAHNTTRRRMFATPEVPNPQPPPSHHHHNHPKDPTTYSKQHQHATHLPSTATTKPSHHPKIRILDPTIKPSYMISNHHIPRSDLFNHHKNPKIPNYNTTTTTKDIHMQAKSLTLSADSLSIIKPKFQLPHRTTKGEKLTKKGTFLEKKDLDSKKQQKELLGVKIKDLCNVKEKEKEKNVVDDDEAARASVTLLCRRRSLDGSRVELGDILAKCGVRVVAVDMPPFMQIHAVDFARKTHDSLEKFSSKTLALSLKKEFDGVYGPAWHCVVGTSFGSFVTHSVGGFLYFSMDHKLYILLFKTSVQRAD